MQRVAAPRIRYERTLYVNINHNIDQMFWTDMNAVEAFERSSINTLVHYPIADNDCYRIAYRTVKPFNLPALKVGSFTCIFIFAPFILANSSYTVPTLE